MMSSCALAPCYIKMCMWVASEEIPSVPNVLWMTFSWLGTYHLPAHVGDMEDGGGRPPAVHAEKMTLFKAEH